MRREIPGRQIALEVTADGAAAATAAGGGAGREPPLARSSNRSSAPQTVRHGHVAAAAPGNTTNGDSATGKDDAKSPWYTQLGFLIRVVACLVVVEALAALLFEWSHGRWVDVDVSQALPAVDEERRPALRHAFSGFGRLVWPYFRASENTKGRMCFALVIFLGLLGLFLAFVHNVWHKDWWDLFQKADSKKFPQLMATYVLIVVAVVLVQVYSGYLRSWVYIDWREFMTQSLLRRWLASHTHFLIQLGGAGANGEAQSVDNPDQRLQEDIHLFVSAALDIAPELLNSVGHLLVFIPIVVSMEPKMAFGMFHLRGWLLYLALVYSVFGTLCTHLIGWPMVNYSFARQRYEADFRHFALHIRNNSESVALYNSERTERENLSQQFQRIKLVQWRQMLLTKRLTFFTSAYSFVQFLVPFFILAPSYFRKEISLGDLFQLTGAIHNVANSFDWFLRIYGPLSDWRATANRLLSFEDAMAEAHRQAANAGAAGLFKKRLLGSTPGASTDTYAGGSSSAASASSRSLEAGEGPESPLTVGPGEVGAMLKAEIARISMPDGSDLWVDVHVEIPQGHKVLISGPEGIGKSVLFKALAGIWPYVEGRNVQLPALSDDEVLFLPQRPALPKTCSLAEALAYPESRESYSDAALLQALRDVQLEELASGIGPSESGEGAAREAAKAAGADAVAPSGPSSGGSEPGGRPGAEAGGAGGAGGGLDQVDCWGSRLSPGQQQRLALAHVLLRRPRVVFLDEATSNVSTEAAALLYSVLAAQLPAGATTVSISHDVATLAPLHDSHVAMEGDGKEKRLRVLKGAAVASALGS